ncbi:hypothetical protein CJU90_2587 [Yarrowia sp. C11]|nr:hypothetical protein CKK34_4035 [Yarrowia sp. E02]KAG5369140.1 hypothetical protein CJU90_2587 [Yarrowia sp. C11]
MARIYPKQNLKNALRTRTEKNVGKKSDVLVYLDYVLFLNKLMTEARKEAKGHPPTALDIAKARGRVLRQFRG